MSRDTGLADRLRADGLIVEEVAGWQNRGRDNFNGQGGVYHHTAGGPTGRAPSLGICINGGPNTAPGPLCNVLQTRESSGPDHIVVIAAGTANHAGRGGWRGLSGNNSVWGIEIEHVGTEPLPDARRDVAVRAMAAMIRGTLDNALNVCQHSEWSYPPGSKIDVATGVNAFEWRQLTNVALQGGAAPPPEDIAEGEPMLIIKESDGTAAIIFPPHRPQKIASVNSYQRGTFVVLPDGAFMQYWDDALKIYNAAIK